MKRKGHLKKQLNLSSIYKFVTPLRVLILFVRELMQFFFGDLISYVGIGEKVSHIKFFFNSWLFIIWGSWLWPICWNAGTWLWWWANSWRRGDDGRKQKFQLWNWRFRKGKRDSLHCECTYCSFLYIFHMYFSVHILLFIHTVIFLVKRIFNLPFNLYCIVQFSAKMHLHLV